MRESQDARVVVVWVEDGPEAKVSELGRNFCSAFRRLAFDHESVQAPSHNGDVASIAEFAGGIEPRRILGAREEGIEEVYEVCDRRAEDYMIAVSRLAPSSSGTAARKSDGGLVIEEEWVPD
jgi:hypothetical protein